MTKQNQVKEYNQNNKGYNITNIKKMTSEQLTSYAKYGAGSLFELYQNPSNAKVSSYNDILNTYDPKKIISVQGSAHSYSVVLQAANDDILHITKANNYLVKVAN